MREVKQGMQAAARRSGVGVTNQAINSIAYTAIQAGGGGIATLSFKEYLRFVDMGAGRGHPLGGLKTMKVALQSKRQEGIAQVKDNVRRSKKVYSKTAYGKLNYLSGKLLYGYTEETVAMMKKEMEQKNS